MGGFRNGQNNKPQRKMRPTQATYKQPASATEIDAYLEKENSCDTVTISRAGNGVERGWILWDKPAWCWTESELRLSLHFWLWKKLNSII